MATPSGRRQYGSGCIVADGPGKWIVRVSIGRDPQTGAYRQKTRRVRGSRADASRALDELRSSKSSSVPTSLPDGVTLNELIQKYFERGSKLQPGTRRTYLSLWNVWLKGGIGRKRAADVNAYDFADLWAYMGDKGMSALTCYSTYALLKGAYRAAAKFDEFEFNTSRFVVPDKPQTVFRPHTEDFVLASVWTAANELGEPWPFLIRLALATGARRGELLALRWDSLADDDLLASERSVDFDTHGTLVLTKTKSKIVSGVDDHSRFASRRSWWSGQQLARRVTRWRWRCVVMVSRRRF